MEELVRYIACSLVEHPELVQVKTTNLGSLFKLTYRIELKEAASEKALIDAIRCRNGNLEVSIGRQEGNAGEL